MSELLPPAIKNSVMSTMMAILFQETDKDLPICFNTSLPSSNKYILIHLQSSRYSTKESKEYQGKF